MLSSCQEIQGDNPKTFQNMAKVVKVDRKVYLEINLSDCELILEAVKPLETRLESHIRITEYLLEDGPISEKKMRKYEKDKEQLNSLKELVNSVIEIGNML